MDILIRRGEDRFGPYTLDETRGYLAEGRLVSDDLASADEGASWRPLGHLVPEFAAHPPAGVAEPSVVPAPPGRYRPGDPVARFGAALIDLLVAGAFLLPGGLSWSGGGEMGWDDRAVALIMVGIATGLIYLLVKDGLDGRSVGKRVTGLIVIHLPSNRPCSIGRSALRTIVFYLSSLLPVIGSLIEPILVIATPDRRRLGDRAASTQVVRLADYLGGAGA